MAADSPAGHLDWGSDLYVVANPHQRPARVVAGPIRDLEKAEDQASIHLMPNAVVMSAVRLVHAIQHQDYAVEWDDHVEPPAALNDERQLVSGVYDRVAADVLARLFEAAADKTAHEDAPSVEQVHKLAMFAGLRPETIDRAREIADATARGTGGGGS